MWKIAYLIIALLLISLNFHVTDTGDSNSIIIGYSGNPSNLISFLSSMGISYFHLGNYYLLYGNTCNFFFNIPLQISKDIFFIREPVKVKPFIEYSSDPYTINDIISAYGISNLKGKGENFTGIVLVPYGDPYIYRNLNYFDSRFGIGNANISVYYFPSPPKDFPSSWVSETDLDVEVLHATAPEAKILLFVTKDDNVSTLEMALKYIVDNKLGDVVSMSWGGPELQVYDSFFHETIKEAAEKGITLIASSGDTGDVYYPASDPYVLSVGGTSLVTSNGKYSYEYVWKNSGGGISSIFKEPLWQIPEVRLEGRGVPDLSLDADPDTGVFIYSNGIVGMGGTSLSAPLLAGMLLDVDSIKGYSLGFITPQLYYLHENYKNYFHPILYNNTFSFSWEVKTGLGSPIIDNWSFPYSYFGASVFLGNFTNADVVQFSIRGIKEESFHIDDSFSFFALLKGNENVSIGYKIPEGKFFYSWPNGTVYFGNVNKGFLYNLKIFIKNSTIILDGVSYKMPFFPGNFSLYAYSLAGGNESYYTNLGPAEFRNFIVISGGIPKYPEKIISVENKKSIYGAMEIPFIYNDFLIGKVDGYAEKNLWPGNFSYTKVHNFILGRNSIPNFPWIVGTGRANDPYIISGFDISGYVAILINISGEIVFKNIRVSGIFGIVDHGNNSIYIINSSFSNLLGIQCISCKLIIENSTFFTIFSIYSLFSSISLEKDTFYSLAGIFPLFGSVSMQSTWIISPIPFLTNYFIGVPNYLFISIWFLIIFFILILRKKKK